MTSKNSHCMWRWQQKAKKKKPEYDGCCCKNTEEEKKMILAAFILKSTSLGLHENVFACLPGYVFIISRLSGFDAYLESDLISSGHCCMSGHEKDTHTRQRNIPGPGGAIYLSPSRFKILIKINLTQFTHSAICLFIRIMLIISAGQKNYYPFCT